MRHLTRNYGEEALQKKRQRSRDHYHENPDYYKYWGKNHIESRLCSVAKTRARKRGVEFSITKNDIILPTHCPILGIKLEYNVGTGSGGKDNSYSLDRIDPAKGYTGHEERTEAWQRKPK